MVAFRQPWNDSELPQPKMTASGGTPEFASLDDGNIVKTVDLPIPGR